MNQNYVTVTLRIRFDIVGQREAKLLLHFRLFIYLTVFLIYI